MSFRTSTLEVLTRAGEKGLSCQEIVSEVPGSSILKVYHYIYTLKKLGHKIVCKNFRYYLSPDGKIVVSTPQKVSSPSPSPKDPTKPTMLLKLLVDAGRDGETKEVLSKKIGVEQRNLVYHIHCLRALKCRIMHSRGKYYLNGKVPESLRSPLENGGGVEKRVPGNPTNGHSKAPIVSMPGSIEIPDKVLKKVQTLDPVLRNEYLEYYRKSLFYGMVAESIISSSNHIHNIIQEVSLEA